MLDSADVLIPRKWNQPEAAAVTVETTKAKGPTSCTKRTVLRLRNEREPTAERRPNVMELAIKWDVRSPPPSAGTRQRKEALAATRKPAEKTLDWLYDQVPTGRPIENSKDSRNQVNTKVIRNQTNGSAVPKTLAKQDSQYINQTGSVGSRQSTGSYARVLPCPAEKAVEQTRPSKRDESDPESGYSSPRSADGEQNKMPLTDLDEPVKAVYRSTASSATPPKNHFLVSTTGYGSNMNNQVQSEVLPEYPLQRRSPIQERHHSKPLPITESKKVNQQHIGNGIPVNEYPPQRIESITSDNYRGQTTLNKHISNGATLASYEDDDRSHPQHHQYGHHQYDRDSGVGDLHDPTEEEYADEEPDQADEGECPVHRHGQASHGRSRPCLACKSPSNSKTHSTSREKLKNHGKTPFKLAMKAGVPSVKSTAELEKVTQRRQSYRAPKPAPLSSHARHIRGTLAPPLAAGNGIEPIVDYPDFKRLDSTYRLSYGSHLNPQRRRQKTLTAILNEKSCRQWRS